jgi:hypothetical protein
MEQHYKVNSRLNEYTKYGSFFFLNCAEKCAVLLLNALDICIITYYVLFIIIIVILLLDTRMIRVSGDFLKLPGTFRQKL